jgi:hypothetical protein
MDLKSLFARVLPSAIHAAAGFSLPPLVLEIQPDFVVGAKLDLSARRVRRIAVAGLDPGAINAHSSRANVANGAALREAIARVIELTGNGSSRSGLVLSDATVRASVLPLETMPEASREADTLVRWKIKQHLPYPAEEARLSYEVTKLDKGFEVLALAGRSSVLAQYEAVLEENSGTSSLVLPSTAALLPLLTSSGDAPQLLLSVCSGWVSSVIVCGGRVCFWRTRETSSSSPGVEYATTGTEASRVLASARDHMKIEIERIWLCARPPAAAEQVRHLADSISHPVETLTPPEEIASGLTAAEKSTFDRFGASFAGLLLNL